MSKETFRLIVHIEFDADAVPADWIKDRLDDVLSQALEQGVGWRYFDSLEDALTWERGERETESPLQGRSASGRP